MRWWEAATAAVVCLSVCDAQTWITGDNSTVEGCSSACSVVDDGDLTCWNKTLKFYEKVLIGQMRHYASVQVDIDQWHRRHGKKDGQNMTRVTAEAEAAMLSHWQGEDDIMTKDIIRQVTQSIMGRVGVVSDHTMPYVPHFQCPIPCEYKHSVYRNLFIASMILNACLVVAVVPFVRRLFRKGDEAENVLIPGRGGSPNNSAF